MKQQTAVEWLEEICNKRGYNLMSDYFNQAKEKEKQQIIDELEDVLYEDDKIDFDDPNYRKDVIEYGLTKVNNLKKELYAKS
jgi:hypothetical protein